MLKNYIRIKLYALPLHCMSKKKIIQEANTIIKEHEKRKFLGTVTMGSLGITIRKSKKLLSEAQVQAKD